MLRYVGNIRGEYIGTYVSMGVLLILGGTTLLFLSLRGVL